MQHLPSPPAGASDMDDQPEIKSLFAKLKGALPEMEALLEKCSSHCYPVEKLNEYFMQIVAEGTGKTFSPEDNQIWLETTRPIVEAFFHARHFLEMAVKYGRQLGYPPRVMPSGWAALLYLYNLR
jgi:hypothetical protein